jgi:hypothetical protein
MPGNRDEIEVGWVRRAELFYIHRPSDCLRRIAYNNALRTRGLCDGGRSTCGNSSAGHHLNR